MTDVIRKKCVNVFLLQILVLNCLCSLVLSRLNLYIFQEDLKKDLHLDFGSDMYLITDGEPASLLLKPDSFRDLVAPLPSTIDQICFRWSSYPLAENEHIHYTIQLSSSDVDIMPAPKLTVPVSSVVPLYEHDDSGFKLLFPCSGLKEGVVDLGFHLNYTSDSFSEEKHLNVIVRRHCTKRDILTNATITRAVHPASSHSMQSLVIGLSVTITLLIVVLLFCIVHCQLQKRKKELHKKFDRHYELIMKNKEQTFEVECERNPKEEIENETTEQDELLSSYDNEHNATPIFVPKINSKWRSKSRTASRHIKHAWMDSTKLPYYTSSLPSDLKLSSHFGLDKILEEDADTSDENNTETEILSNNHAVVSSGTVSEHSEINGTASEHPEISGTLTCIDVNNAPNSAACTHEVDIGSCHCAACKKQQTCFRTSVKKKKDNCIYNKRHSNKKKKDKGKLVNNISPPSNFVDGCNTVPMHRKTNINKLVKNVREDENGGLSTCEKKLQGIYQYMNNKWMKQFHDTLIPYQQIIVGKHPLGKGASGNVHHGKLRSLDNDDNITLTPVALKTLTSSPDDCDCITKFFTEALMMRRLQHKNIMPLLGVMLQNNQSPIVVMPYLKNADLNQFLRNARGTPKRHQALSTRQLINFGSQIACGMEYLASIKYVHRDLSSRNCMVGENLEVKISNLGLARDISKENYRMSRKTRLPIKWMAPECLTNFVFSEKSDVWSYGVVLWEIINMGKQPYSGLSNQDILEYLQQGQRLPRTQKCPEELYHLMSLCWIDSPHDRPFFEQLHKEISVCEGKYQKYSIQYTSNLVT